MDIVSVTPKAHEVSPTALITLRDCFDTGHDVTSPRPTNQQNR